MTRKIIVLFMGILLLAGCSKKNKNIMITLPLSEEEMNQAIEYGIKNAELSMTEFVSEWTVDLGYGEGKGKATLITPFLKTAILSKQAHNQGQEIKRALLEKALREDTDCLTFEITLFGGYPEFGRTAEFLLKCNNKEIQPVYKFTPPYAEIGRDYTQTIKGKVKFNKKDIPADSKIVLWVQYNMDEEGKNKYTCEFEFDLKKYR
ncbi:MAG: hypothetical protein N3D17_06550 [bacterium]|nr:hypothetical protein [bacterium]